LEIKTQIKRENQKSQNSWSGNYIYIISATPTIL